MSNVTFTWAPNPALLAASVDAVAASLNTRVVPLAAASEFIQEDIRERFMTETDPDGSPWKPLSDSYVYGGWFQKEPPPHTQRRKRGTTLKDTMALMEAASSSAAQIVTNDAVFYQTKDLPSHGLAHQFGLDERTPPLPARPFLGMSDASAAKVWALFSEWFDESIRLYPTSTGKVGARHSITATVPGMRGRPFVSRASVGKGPLPST